MARSEKADDHCDAARFEFLVDEFDQFGLGGFESGWLEVCSRHTRGGVDQKDVAVSTELAALPAGAETGEDRQ